MERLPKTSPEPTATNALSDEDWRGIAKGMIKAELKMQNLTYADLSKRLASMGVEESEASIRNKVSRGTFSFVFALQAFRALDAQLMAFRPTYTMHVNAPEGFDPQNHAVPTGFARKDRL